MLIFLFIISCNTDNNSSEIEPDEAIITETLQETIIDNENQQTINYLDWKTFADFDYSEIHKMAIKIRGEDIIARRINQGDKKNPYFHFDDKWCILDTPITNSNEIEPQRIYFVFMTAKFEV